MRKIRKSKNLFRTSIPGIILLGILGSALWEKVFSPLSTFLFITISNKIEDIKIGITDNVYYQISHSSNNLYSQLCLWSILTAYFVIVFLIRRKYANLKELIQQEPSSRIKDDTISPLTLIEKLVLAGLCVLGVLELILFFYLLGGLQFIDHSRNHTLANIEIVAPYIEDQDYKMLKSDFYSIQCKDDFDALSKTLKNIASENNLYLQ